MPTRALTVDEGYGTTGVMKIIHFGGNNKCKSMMVLRDFPYNSAFVWVGFCL